MRQNGIVPLLAIVAVPVAAAAEAKIRERDKKRLQREARLEFSISYDCKAEMGFLGIETQK